MPDFFHRLAARAAGLPSSQPRALPRLAHPFERAVVAQETEPVAASLSRPAASAPPVIPPVVVERHTETVRHERESQQSTVVERHLTTMDSSVHHVLERLEVAQPPLLVPVAPPAPAPVAAVLIQPPEPAGATPVASQPAPAVAQPVRAWTAVAKAASVPARRAAAPEPERVVHVSIGRVEVKAAAPAARPPRSTGRVAPAVPLEKYLAREGS
jgi:hypothetical protein